VIKVYAAGTSGECSQLSGRFSEAADVEELYTRHCERFPQLRGIVSRVAVGDVEPEALVEFIGQTYRLADPSLDAIPPQTDTGYDSWCPRDREEGAKYWDRVPLNAMTGTGYFNCLYAAALTARAFSEAGHEFSLLTCPAVPTHPYLQLAARPGLLFSFHHDGLRRHQGQVEIKNLWYAPETLLPISDYGPRDGVYGLSIPEHFLILTRLVPTADNAERAIGAFGDLAAALGGYPRLAPIAALIRRSIIPRLRSGPIPFARTVEDDTETMPSEPSFLGERRDPR
jgi:hypothetical protein